MKFEWDENKNTLNKSKHGIDFLTATAVFDDPYRLQEDSSKPEHGEVRIKTIGLMGSTLIVTVVYTNRKQQRRLISARRASKNEREKYYSNC